ncbi:TniQ family protein [Candidatus Methylomirabilis limnetica]
MYEPWDLSPPVVPPRSSLYCLEPIGIGTPFVESLTGYIARLACAHAVSVADLVKLKLIGDMAKSLPLSPQGGTPHWTSRHGFNPMGYTLNCMTDTSGKWIEALEAATLRRDLSALTLLPFAGGVTAPFLVRKVRAWCPRCYQERREANSDVYDSLLWALRVVTVCPRHQQQLVTTCPHCDREQHPLAAYSYPGSCSRCRRWLGLQQDTSGADGATRQEVVEYQFWVANTLGEFLATALRLPSRLPRPNIRQNLWSYVNHLTGGNMTAFADLVQSPRIRICSWLAGQRIPRLDSLLRVCYHLGISLVTLVTGDPWDPDVSGPLKESARFRPNRGRVWPHRPNEVRRVLKAALHEEPTPSVAAIAHRMGYSGTGRLYQVDQDLCRRITANHRRARYSPGRKRPGAGRICDEATIKQSLEQSLAQAQPTALHRLAQRLGYANAVVLRSKYPDLCRAISAKRIALRKTRLNAVELALQAALEEDPPPSLREMTRRLGPSWLQSLRQHFPVLCDALENRRKQYRDSRGAELQKAFMALLSEDPPPSVVKACQRVGVSQGTFSSKFPDLRSAVAARYVKHRAEAKQKRKELLREKIRHSVLQLHRQGIFPSWSRVMSLLSKDSLKDWDLRARYFKEARQELE